MKKIVILTIILAILLAFALGYIGYGFFQYNQIQNQNIAYQEGFVAGYEQAIIAIIKTAVTCEQVPLYVGNQTVNMIAVDCLVQG